MKVKMTFGMDYSITYEIDTEIFTEEKAKEVNDFWGGSDDRLRCYNKNIYLAALSLYSATIYHLIFKHEIEVTSYIGFWFKREDYEGYYWIFDKENPEETNHGIKVVDFNFDVDIPGSEDFEAEIIDEVA